MTFINNGRFEKFPNKVWLASPTMHDGAEMKYVKEAYDTKLDVYGWSKYQ